MCLTSRVNRKSWLKNEKKKSKYLLKMFSFILGWLVTEIAMHARHLAISKWLALRWDALSVLSLSDDLWLFKNFLVPWKKSSQRQTAQTPSLASAAFQTRSYVELLHCSLCGWVVVSRWAQFWHFFPCLVDTRCCSLWVLVFFFKRAGGKRLSRLTL